jgi:hypothetical protein
VFISVLLPAEARQDYDEFDLSTDETVSGRPAQRR